MRKILVSFGLTGLVSTLFALLFKSIVVFFIAFILQILFFYIFNTIYENFLIQKAVKMQIELEKNIKNNFTKVLCPCGENNPQDVKLSLNEDTIYNCSKCKKEVRATTNIGTTLITTPLYTNKNAK